MGKTTYFMDAVKEWLADLEVYGMDTEHLELENEKFRLCLGACKMPENSGKVIGLLTVKTPYGNEVFDFLYSMANDVREQAKLLDCLSCV